MTFSLTRSQDGTAGFQPSKTTHSRARVFALYYRNFRYADDQEESDKFSTFMHRQPEHIEIAGALGLGVWDRAKIDLRQLKAQA